MSGHWLTDDAALANFAYRMLQDTWADASRIYWERRAQRLEAARPRRTDFHGRATPQQLAAAHERLTAAAQACRAKAGLVDSHRASLDDALEDIARGAA